MNTANDGGPAFPSEQHETQDGSWNQTFERGISVRDYFAIKALTGMLASEAGIQAYTNEWAAERAYLLADAMLAARASVSSDACEGEG